MNFNPEDLIKDIDKQYNILSLEDMENYLLAIINNTKNEHGELSLGFGALLNELGGFYRGASKYDKAEEVFIKASDIIDKVAGKNNSNYATTINNLAGVYRLMGNFIKAEELFIKAIEIYKSINLKKSFVYSSVLNNTGLLYLDTKEYQKAVSLFKEANEIAKENCKDIIVYATGLGNLANAYLGLGQIEQAENLLIEAVKLYKEHKGEENLHYASAVNSLAFFYFTTGDNQKAQEFFLYALNLREKYYGQNSHEFAKASHNLSVVYEKTGQYDLALKYLKLCSDAYLNVFGAEHIYYKNSVEEEISLKRKLEENNTKKLDTMSGLELSLVSFLEFSAQVICKKFPEYSDRIAAGLVGEGSECYGYDDEFSKDHDWGASFCIWLRESDFVEIGAKMQVEYDKFFQHYDGPKLKNTNEYSSNRRGVFEIGSFYKKYIGMNHPPKSIFEWQSIPENNLSVATNGKVFVDFSGDFKQFRNKLKAFYPEDIRLKKIAKGCAVMAQAGQYNYPRCLKRSESVAANYALGEFIDSTISVIYLLNKEYKPYYKWMHRGLKDFKILGAKLYDKLVALTVNKDLQLIEEISQEVIKELINQGLSQSNSDFLLDHAHEVKSRINNNDIKAMHILS